MRLYLFEGDRWAARLLQNLTTNSDGVAVFSFSTAGLEGDIKLHVSMKYSQHAAMCHHHDKGRIASSGKKMFVISKEMCMFLILIKFSRPQFVVVTFRLVGRTYLIFSYVCPAP